MSLQNLTRRGARGLMAVALPSRLCGQTTARHWAEPVDLAGVPNLHRVTPLIYRSAPPSAEGFHNLAKIGVKTVINLRRTVDDSPLAVGTGLALIHIKITTRHVTDGNGAKIALALRALRDAQSPAGPVLLHCTHGADRTGIIAALWRMLYQGWSRDQALEELQQGGFGFHAVWINIPQYLRHVDLNDLKTRIASEPA